MGEILILIRTALVGVLLGGMFYAGLWWTVRRSVSVKSRRRLASRRFPAADVRISVGGFYLVARGDWRALLACLLGFLMARICVTRLTRAPSERKSPLFQGVGR